LQVLPDYILCRQRTGGLVAAKHFPGDNRNRHAKELLAASQPEVSSTTCGKATGLVAKPVTELALSLGAPLPGLPDHELAALVIIGW
jgi:hypothetical protein